MVQLQIISRGNADVQAEIRRAIEEERMKTFEIVRLRGGLRLRHKRFRGEVHFMKTEGTLLLSVKSPGATDEWQLLSALIGRLADRFKDQISGINIQLEAAPTAKAKKRAKKKAKRRAAKRALPRRSR